MSESIDQDTAMRWQKVMRHKRSLFTAGTNLPAMLIVSVALSALLSSSPTFAESATTRPNIVLIMADDQGY